MLRRLIRLLKYSMGGKCQLDTAGVGRFALDVFQNHPPRVNDTKVRYRNDRSLKTRRTAQTDAKLGTHSGTGGVVPVERDIYYAAGEISKSTEEIRTFGLIEHSFVRNVSRPTFFRALKSLVNKGYLSQSGNSNRGRYVVQAPR